MTESTFLNEGECIPCERVVILIDIIFYEEKILNPHRICSFIATLFANIPFQLPPRYLVGYTGI